MSDTALPEPTALPNPSDVPPSSSGRESAHSGAVDQAAIPDELKARLDKVTHSEVSRHERGQLGFCAVRSPCEVRANEDRVACRSVSPPSSLG
jgi:hypothetical protein